MLEKQRTRRVFLELFFTEKTHKPECLLRVIVSEASTWQVRLSRYLHRHLSGVACDDPLLVRSSNEIVQVLQTGLPNALTAFSIAVEDTFYSVPHGGLFNAVQERITQSGEIGFQNSTVFSSDHFPALLEFILRSTVVNFNGQFYV